MNIVRYLSVLFFCISVVLADLEETDDSQHIEDLSSAKAKEADHYTKESVKSAEGQDQDSKSKSSENPAPDDSKEDQKSEAPAPKAADGDSSEAEKSKADPDTSSAEKDDQLQNGPARQSEQIVTALNPNSRIPGKVYTPQGYYSADPYSPPSVSLGPHVPARISEESYATAGSYVPFAPGPYPPPRPFAPFPAQPYLRHYVPPGYTPQHFISQVQPPQYDSTDYEYHYYPNPPAPAPAPAQHPVPQHPAPAPQHPAPAPQQPAPVPQHPAPAPQHPAPVAPTPQHPLSPPAPAPAPQHPAPPSAPVPAPQHPTPSSALVPQRPVSSPTLNVGPATFYPALPHLYRPFIPPIVRPFPPPAAPPAYVPIPTPPRPQNKPTPLPASPSVHVPAVTEPGSDGKSRYVWNCEITPSSTDFRSYNSFNDYAYDQMRGNSMDNDENLYSMPKESVRKYGNLYTGVSSMWHKSPPRIEGKSQECRNFQSEGPIPQPALRNPQPQIFDANLPKPPPQFRENQQHESATSNVQLPADSLNHQDKPAETNQQRTKLHPVPSGSARQSYGELSVLTSPVWTMTKDGSFVPAQRVQSPINAPSLMDSRQMYSQEFAGPAQGWHMPNPDGIGPWSPYSRQYSAQYASPSSRFVPPSTEYSNRHKGNQPVLPLNPATKLQQPLPQNAKAAEVPDEELSGTVNELLRQRLSGVYAALKSLMEPSSKPSSH